MTDQPTQNAAAAALLHVNRRRRRIRRWVAIATLPITIAALLLAGKLLSMYVLAHQSITHFVTDAYAESESAARGLDVANWFVPFIAPYDIGTAMAGAEKLPEARAELERALPLAQGMEVCYVRINLSLLMERQGDAAQTAGDAARAAEFYGEALTMTLETPEECSDEDAQSQSPDPERDMSDTLDDNQQRQQQKQQQSQQDPDRGEQPQQPDQGEAEDEQPSQSDLDEIEKKLNQGDQDRESQLGDQGDQGSGGGTDKPW